MITQQYKLNIIPSFNGPVVVKCSQYDKDSRSIEFSLFNGANPFVLDSNYTITVRGTKKDGTAFEYDCSIADGKVVFLLNQQMTLFDGKYPCELRIINGAEILGSSNFTLFVEKSPMDENAIISESDLPAYEKLLNDLQNEKISSWLDENITQETGYVLDSSLTVQGAAADAKAVGNALATLEEKIDDGDSGTGLTDEIAQALLACFQNVAWINADGQDYYAALEEALENAGGVQYTVTNLLSQCTNSNNSIKATEGKKYIAVLTANPGHALSAVTVTMGGIDVTGTYYSGGTISIPNVTGDIVITAVATSLVSSITAVFTQGSAVIYDTDSLDVLKQYLVVNANYSDGSSAALADSDYTLSGTLTAGTSTITVSYGGKTTTFSVTVNAVLYNLQNQAIVSTDTDDYFETGINVCQADFACTIFLDMTTTSNATSGNTENPVPKYLFEFNHATGVSGRCLTVGKQEAKDTVLRFWWMSTAADDYYTLTGISPDPGRFRFAVMHDANSDLAVVKCKKDSGEILTLECTRTFIPALETDSFSFGTSGNHGFPLGTIHLARICEGVASADRIGAFFE